MTENVQTCSKNLVMVADLGASNPKFIVSLKKKKVDHLILDPQIKEVPASLVEKYRQKQEWLTERSPTKDAFLQLPEDENYWVFGSLSDNFETEQEIDQEAKKYEYGALKILCALGLIVQENKIKARHFNLDLCVLLPIDEIGDKEIFLTYFKKIVERWYFRGEEFSCSLRKIEVEREGIGLLKYLLGSKSYKEKYQAEKVGLVMAGYRNLSLFSINGGELDVKKSPIKGFHQCIENIAKTNASINPIELNEAMAKTYYSLLPYELEDLPKELFRKLRLTCREHGVNRSVPEMKTKFQNDEEIKKRKNKLFEYDFFDYIEKRPYDREYTFEIKRKSVKINWEKSKEIRKLIKTKNPELFEMEVKSLSNNINKELNSYGEDFKFLLEQNFEDIDRLIIVGGAHIFLYKWICEFCKRFDNIYLDQRQVDNRDFYINPPLSEPYIYNADKIEDTIERDTLPELREELVNDFNLDLDIDYSSIPTRFLDCYCFYKFFKKKLNKERKKKSGEE